ncbi:BRCT domain-containing protein [Nonomuraea jabiensis]|uniref:hypothetical protein n=1 Tax=Nonomuraea jabiensis TaxID=882448 RepID=UPI00367A9CA6
MDLRGRTVVVAGSFRTGSVAKLKARLEEAGASVVDEVSRSVDVVFDGYDGGYPNERVRAAERLGVPVLPVTELPAPAGRTGSGGFPGQADPEAARDDPAALLEALENAGLGRTRPWDLPLACHFLEIMTSWPSGSVALM